MQDIIQDETRDERRDETRDEKKTTYILILYRFEFVFIKTYSPNGKRVLLLFSTFWFLILKKQICKIWESQTKTQTWFPQYLDLDLPGEMTNRRESINLILYLCIEDSI